MCLPKCLLRFGMTFVCSVLVCSAVVPSLAVMEGGCRLVLVGRPQTQAKCHACCTRPVHRLFSRDQLSVRGRGESAESK